MRVPRPCTLGQANPSKVTPQQDVHLDKQPGQLDKQSGTSAAPRRVLHPLLPGRKPLRASI